MNQATTEKIAPHRKWGWLVLFSSTSTLICCALPILLVSIGAGAVSAALFANFPFLSVLAKNKAWLFAGSGLLMTLAWFSVFRPGRTCPSDPILAEQCKQADRWNQRLLLVSAIIWAIGFSAAYLAAPIYRWIG